MNLSELANTRRKEKKQARVLSVQEVRSLESFLANDKNLIVDRFAAGCFLSALFSRSRWSDLRCVYGHTADILEVEGKITAYLEYKTRSHKTARLVQKQGLSMPLVAPVWGVSKTPCVLEFVKVSKRGDRPLDALHSVPLLPAPTEEGEHTRGWLLSVLSRALYKDPEMTAIHCLKSAALSWAGKAGLSAETRQVLGHHSTAKHSHEIYNRDLLAEPIRQLELILERIRTGSFLPDASRSGMITEPTVEDPSKSFRREESESESSESSSTDSSSDAATLHSDQYPEDVYHPMLEKEVWNPDFHMYRHCRTHVVYLLADGTTSETFSCGLKLTSDHIKVDSSGFFRLPQMQEVRRGEAYKRCRRPG